MPETLLSPTRVLMFGRLVNDLTIVQSIGSGNKAKPTHPKGEGANNFLQKQLAADDAKLARIYGFACEGYYYELVKPALFLVHGEGEKAESTRPGNRAARAPAEADNTGVGGQDHSFADDMQVWKYDKGDFSMRLDVESGPLEQILLQTELMSQDGMGQVSGMHARVSGMHARVSGMHARVSGMHARARGKD